MSVEERWEKVLPRNRQPGVEHLQRAWLHVRRGRLSRAIVGRPLTPAALTMNLFCFHAVQIGLAVGAWLHEGSRRARWLSHRLLDEERSRSERLLLNVMPEAIASRLKAGETTIADGLDEVTVLFCDLVGFTQMRAAE